MGQVFKRNEEINSTLTLKLSLFSCIPGFLMIRNARRHEKSVLNSPVFLASL
jgi:hypothetical protein